LDLLKKLSNTFKLKMDSLQSLLPEMIEMHQRRNLLVHNDGVIDQKYLNVVAQNLRNNSKKGDKIKTSRSYIARAFDVCESSMLLLLSEFWAKDRSSVAERAKNLPTISFKALQDERYVVSRTINEHLQFDKTLSEITRVMSKVNYWLSIKYADKDAFKKLISEIEAWDVSALDFDFQIAKFALLDQKNQLEEKLKLSKLPSSALTTWPLFKPFIDEHWFKIAIQRNSSFVHGMGCREAHHHLDSANS
jgi:hypothetical protein